MKQVEEIKRLLLLHTKGELSASEKQQLENWVAQSDANRALYNELTDADLLRAAMKQVYGNAEYIEQHPEYPSLSSEASTPVKSISRRGFYWWVAAASVMGLIAVANYFIFKTPSSKSVAAKVDKPLIHDVQPGGNKATLTLADGSTILLDGASNGNIAQQSGTVVKKLDGLLRYDASHGSGGTSAATFNTVTTPKGGMYRIILPDGSTAWLNAASSLRFPVNFPLAYRAVEVLGEAYFEVKKDRNRPFFVKIIPTKPGTNNTVVQVLGTHFNVNAYGDKKHNDITLLEGSVRIITNTDRTSLDIQNDQNRKTLMSGTGTTLKPGQKGIINENNNRVVVESTKAENAITWIDGVFYFNDEDIVQVMHQLERWYDIKFVFNPGKIDMKETYKGFIPRTMPLSKVLERLQLNVQYHITDKTVTVEP
jgi:ferric-dicitrate binding protein FerR (iron transport regulator)